MQRLLMRDDKDLKPKATARGQAWHLESPAPASPLLLLERPGAGRSVPQGVTHVSLPGRLAATLYRQPALAGLLETRLLTAFIYSLFLNRLSSPQPVTNVLPPPQGMLGGHYHRCNYLDHSIPKKSPHSPASVLF